MDTQKKQETARCCPGGWNCPHCGPSRKEKLEIRRTVRRKEREAVRVILWGSEEDWSAARLMDISRRG
jgi:hypothetical protein